MKRFVLIISAILCIQAGDSTAQTAQSSPKPTPPPGPLIQKRAPGFAQWIIVTTVAPAGAKAPEIPAEKPKGPAKTVVITKTGKIINTAILDQDRHIWSVWNDGGLHIVVSPDGKEIGQAARPLDPDAVNPYFLDYSQTDFPGFEWISAGNFEDIKIYQGKKCLLFEKPGRIAYIDQDTLYPSALVDAEGIHLYQFQPPPTAMQNLPQNVQQFLLNEQYHIQSLANRKIAPF